jgi:hypothetical protein
VFIARSDCRKVCIISFFLKKEKKKRKRKKEKEKETWASEGGTCTKHDGPRYTCTCSKEI